MNADLWVRVVDRDGKKLACKTPQGRVQIQGDTDETAPAAMGEQIGLLLTKPEVLDALDAEAAAR